MRYPGSRAGRSPAACGLGRVWADSASWSLGPRSRRRYSWLQENWFARIGSAGIHRDEGPAATPRRSRCPASARIRSRGSRSRRAFFSLAFSWRSFHPRSVRHPLYEVSSPRTPCAPCSSKPSNPGRSVLRNAPHGIPTPPCDVSLPASWQGAFMANKPWRVEVNFGPSITPDGGSIFRRRSTVPRCLGRALNGIAMRRRGGRGSSGGCQKL